MIGHTVAGTITPTLAEATMSRLMKQLSVPAGLVAEHTYFPDMLLLRLLSFRVPVFSLSMGEKKTSVVGLDFLHLYTGMGFPELDLQLRVTFPFSCAFPDREHFGTAGGTFTSRLSSLVRSLSSGMIIWQK